MDSNPYQSPSIQSFEADPETFVDRTGIPHKDYLQFRRAVALLIATTATFFILFCVQMIRDSMFIDAAIASVFWLVLLAGLRGTLKHRTAGEAKLTRTRYRAISSTMRPLCFWLGPLMIVVGLSQAVYVPAVYQFNPWGFLICGFAAFGCAFHWPRLNATQATGF
jgi:hypothetical protein